MHERSGNGIRGAEKNCEKKEMCIILVNIKSDAR